MSIPLRAAGEQPSRLQWRAQHHSYKTPSVNLNSIGSLSKTAWNLVVDNKLWLWSTSCGWRISSNWLAGGRVCPTEHNLSVRSRNSHCSLVATSLRHSGVACEVMADELRLLLLRRRWRRLRRRNSGHWGPTCAATNNYCFGARRRRRRRRQFAPSPIKQPKRSVLPKRRTRTIVLTLITIKYYY